jgi:nitrogen-specific signal transduction histidine kinase
MELGADLPPVTGDRVQLQQVVVNLILNAIEAMSTAEGRERDLLISTRPGEGDEVRVAGSPIFDPSLLGVRLEGSAVKIAEAAKP